jgi:hypothetical protein
VILDVGLDVQPQYIEADDTDITVDASSDMLVVTFHSKKYKIEFSVF